MSDPATEHDVLPRRTTLSRLRRPLKAAVALALLAALYTAADWRQVGAALAGLHAGYLGLALLLFVPQTYVSALRWRGLAARHCLLTRREAVRHTLAASALNLVLPSKLGDLSKAAMLPVSAQAQRRAALCVVLEKGADVAALGILLAAGCLGLGVLGNVVAVAGLLCAAALWNRRRGGRRVGGWPALCAASLALWTLHLWQIDLFLKAAGVHVAWDVMLARVPLAIFAGLLPVSLWGIGTRDAALVYLFADVAPAATMAGVGLLTALRYLVPGAAGILLVGGVWRAREAAATATPQRRRAGSSAAAA